MPDESNPKPAASSPTSPPAIPLTPATPPKTATPAATTASPTNQPQAAPAPPVIAEEELKRALGAFKKRLKLTKLDQESRLGAGKPLTSGKKSDVMAIIPPNQFPRAVWNELARRGQLRDFGGGFFALP